MTQENLEKIAELAGFKRDGGGRDYTVFQGVNTQRFLLYNIWSEEQVFKTLFRESRIAGKIELKLELHELIDPIRFGKERYEKEES